MAEVYARLLVVTWHRIRQVREARDRGDVPGWVMVTVMTAGLVVGIFAIFSEKIKAAVSDAIDSVVAGTDGSSP